MKKWLLVGLIGLLFTSCYTPDEKIAVDFLKDKMKAPSTFKVLEIESKDYKWQSEDVTYDTIFYNTKKKVTYHYSYYNFDIDQLENGRSQNYFLESYRMKLNQKYDSIVVTKNWHDVSPATWVSISYQANNSFNVPLEGYENIIVRDGEPRFLIDDVVYTSRTDTVLIKKFDNLQKYK